MYNRLVKFAPFGLATALTLAFSFNGSTLQQASAPAVNAVEVLVNDQPISTYDIQQRLQLAVALVGGVKTREEFDKFREQVTESLIDERLQLLTALEFEFEVQAELLEDFFARRAQSMNQTPEGLEQALREIGSSKKSMVEQMRAEFAWSQIVEGRFGSSVVVSDEEVEAVIARIHANKGKLELRLAEIILRVTNPTQEAQVKATADRIVSQVRSGANFAQLAQQLSQSPSAAVNGDIGWVTEVDLDESIKDSLIAASVGDIIEPIRTAGGYRILAISDRRRILSVDPLDEQISLRQFYLTPETIAADLPIKAVYEQQMKAMEGQVIQCEEIDGIAQKMGLESTTTLGTLRLRDLIEDLRNLVSPQTIGQISPIIKSEDGWRVLIICNRAMPQVAEPQFDQIMGNIEQQRLAMISRRYLRDVRREAIIEHRAQ